MILTNCAACAAPLAHNAPRCVRCWTRYCDSTCQHDHWRRGHKQMCKKIHRGGNAEQYNADKKYKEAVAVAVEACADDTKGQIVVQGNLANTYQLLHRYDEALPMRREVYSGFVQLYGEEHGESLREAFNYVTLLNVLNSFEEAKSLMRKTIPKARRIFGENGIDTLKMRVVYAQLLYKDDGGTLDDLREAVTMLEGTERTARCVLGGTHPLVVDTERSLRDARDTLRARETPPGS